MDDITGVDSYGEAHIVQPEKQTSSSGTFISFLVKVRLGEDNYSCRKRYSDFAWLRQAISTCFPGVRIPPLPKKQNTTQGLLAKTGWQGQEDTFLEERRGGLEDFLQGLLRRKELCIDSQILKRFLQTSDDTQLDELKTKIDKVSWALRYKKYSEIFAEYADAEAPDDKRMTAAKSLMSSQTSQLQELVNGLKEVVNAQQAVTKAVEGTQPKLAAVSHTESMSGCFGAGDLNARTELVSGLREHRDAMQAFPAMHYDLLLSATERELLEAEAMLEALDSLDVLEKELDVQQRRAENVGATLQNVLQGGEIPSTGTGVARMLGMAPQKDREESIAKIKADHERCQTEVSSIKDFKRLARVVLISSEIDQFFKDKVSQQRKVKDTFASLSRKAAERLMSAWETKASFGTSHGYPAAVDDIEYEN